MNEEAATQRKGQTLERSAADAIVCALTDQLKVVMCSAQQVATHCSDLKRLQATPPTQADAERLVPLLPFLAQRSGPEILPLFELVEQTAASVAHPWQLVKGMLGARSGDLLERALHVIRRRTEDGSLALDRPMLHFVAQLVGSGESSLSDTPCLLVLRDIFGLSRGLEPTGQGDVLEHLFLNDQNQAVRDLAARLLDVSGEPVRRELAARVLAKEALEFLWPYLQYSRATHRDLLCLIPPTGEIPLAVPDLRHAHERFGEEFVRRIIADIGWPRLNLGLDIRHYSLVTRGDSVPLVLFPREASLARRCGDVQERGSSFVITAHGGTASEGEVPDLSTHPVSRFREYNLLHAQALGEFLALAPLTRDRTLAMVDLMGKIVREFDGLFSSLLDECSILPDVFGTIRGKILAELESETAHDHLSIELTRLVMMFEDPPSLGQVQTLHGLKRYLHQKGLQLGFKLMHGGASTNRTVDVLVASRERILHRYAGIRYSDFEPEATQDRSHSTIPYPVRIVAEGFARQAIVGQESFPRVDIFCYGNEVQYYLAYKNHPAFCRVNYAPPLQGGMIDLEYYGVSKYEMAEHPDLALGALRRFFRVLDFDCQIDATRVHARYDKEQAPDLESLCEKAEALFRLAPYLLDIDWTIGSLRLDEESRKAVAAAWASSFETWGVLPLESLLSEDRQGVVESISSTPTGRLEVIWSGRGPYRDRFSAWPDEFFQRFFGLAEELSLDVVLERMDGAGRRGGQLTLERSLLRPLRKAVARGEVAEAARGYGRAPAYLFQREAVAEKFAEIIATGGARLDAAAALGGLVAPLERIVPFRTTGSVGTFEVQTARLPLKGDELGLFVMRGEQGVICLAFYTLGDVLYRRRAASGDEWKSNAQFDTGDFLARLRRANYPAPVMERVQEESAEALAKIRATLAEAPRRRPRIPVPGEQTIAGLRASPGRMVGPVRFGVTGRVPSDLDSAVLVTPALRPEDAPFLYHAAGVITTGGGILSHAGLLAVQFRKPAIIVAGRWESHGEGTPSLSYRSMSYDVEEKQVHDCHITIRRRIREHEHTLAEGDLVALESGEESVRVLGQDRDVLSFHGGFRRLGRSARDLAETEGDRETLRLRGERLRARHEIEKVLVRLADPALACHAASELLSGSGISAAETTHLVRLLLDNPTVGRLAHQHVGWMAERLLETFRGATRLAQKRIPDSQSLYEILTLRLDSLHAYSLLIEARAALGETGLEATSAESLSRPEFDEMALVRLTHLRHRTAKALTALDERTLDARVRHLLRQFERMDRLISAPGEEKKAVEAVRVRLERADDGARAELASRSVIWPGDGGLELFEHIGWKAANLAEISRVTGRPLVPEWFGVTDRAFRRVLGSPVEKSLLRGGAAVDGSSTLLEAIQAILANERLDLPQKCATIRGCWEAAAIPSDLLEEVLAAYRRLGKQSLGGGDETADGVLVALRSSSHEEDAEIAARAGEFDTFLFIRGEGSLITHLKRTWAGLWSERALHHRSILGTSGLATGGGVIVQRIVRSRVSGVVQTVNLAQNDFRQIVINVGLGLGQGIVSGAVAADHIVVSKDENLKSGPLHFRYTTAEKRDYVIFDRRAGFGTIQCEAPFHKRRRPALEYAELRELVADATALEEQYGYPLDIEFGIEGNRLWILQARPVPASMASFQETIEQLPLTPTAPVDAPKERESRP